MSAIVLLIRGPRHDGWSVADAMYAVQLLAAVGLLLLSLLL